MTTLARIAAFLASFVFAGAYAAWSGTGTTPAEVLFISVGAGVAALVVGLTVHALTSGNQADWREWRIIRNLLLIAALVAFAALTSFWLQRTPAADLQRGKIWWQFVAVGCLSGLVGYGEIVSRYRDEPGWVAAAGAAATYVGVNVLAGLAALMLVHEFAVFDGDAHQWVKEVLLAGFGAIAFFRTSLFNVRVGGNDIGIGPSAVLKSLLDASELMIDRWQAGNRSNDASEIMQDVDFEKARKTVPVMCFSMVQQAVTDEQQKGARQSIDDLAGDKSIPPAAKPLILGVYMIRLVGAEVLRKAVATLDRTIK